MARTLAYVATLIALVVATTLSLTATLQPLWITYHPFSSRSASLSSVVSDNIGLFRRCISSSAKCQPFPAPANPLIGHHPERISSFSFFCPHWRTARLQMTFVAIVQFTTLMAILFTLYRQRLAAWRDTMTPTKKGGGGVHYGIVIAGLLWLAAAGELVALGIVSYLFDHDDLFLVPGYELGPSFHLALISSGISLLAGVGLVMASWVLEEEEEEEGRIFLGDNENVPPQDQDL
ncbi:hypothetical protein QBC35DRAFT_482166 [Podospora australis]|uniref:Uncharacterized protein n=1 Tax=Podospora australis TaxID=1536484 RepID=A0AAN6X2R0_9PEZI|nr:hypothetical protein QBC35DRAFT_482166 [Podospora australis]